MVYVRRRIIDSEENGVLWKREREREWGYR